MPIPITEEDVTIITDKDLVVINKQKFEDLLKYTEDIEDELAFTKYELEMIKYGLHGIDQS